jgi:hypothetical protein
MAAGRCEDGLSGEAAQQTKPHPEERVFARLEGWATFAAMVRDARKSALLTMRTLIGKDHFP